MAECTVLLLPLDVANASGSVGCGVWNNSCGGLDIATTWQVAYIVIAALVLTVAFPIDAHYTVLQVFGFMLLITLSVGGALGLVVALILDRTIGRRTITTEATRETVGNPEA
jgi:hypothetical protein